jgi:hypothetical protein
MIRFSKLIAAAATLCAATLMAVTTHAITLPDSSSCSSGTACLQITNTNTSASGIAVYGINSSNGYGLKGEGATGVLALGAVRGLWAQAGSAEGVRGESSSSDGVRGYTDNANAAGGSFINNAGGLAIWGTGNIQITGSAFKPGGGSWTNPSDARIKKDVMSLQWGLSELRRIRPVMYRYNGLGGTEDDGRQYVGVIAQELEKVLPDMVSSRKGRLNQTDAEETEIRLVDPSAFTYVLINAVIEQQRMIERQAARLATLERARGPLSASMTGGSAGMYFALGLVPLALIAFRRRRNSRG